MKGALHLGNKDKDKNKKKGGGGIFSRTGGDKDKKKEVDKGEGKGGLFHREDEDEKERKSGFKGLFAEGPLPEAGGGGGGGGAAMEAEGEEKPQSASANDGGTYEEQDCTSLRHTEATACSAASLYMATLKCTSCAAEWIHSVICHFWFFSDLLDDLFELAEETSQGN